MHFNLVNVPWKTDFITMLCLLFRIPTVHVPSVIQQQMVFTQNTMLKAFLAAVTTCENLHANARKHYVNKASKADSR